MDKLKRDAFVAAVRGFCVGLPDLYLSLDLHHMGSCHCEPPPLTCRLSMSACHSVHK